MRQGIRDRFAPKPAALVVAVALLAGACAGGGDAEVAGTTSMNRPRLTGNVNIFSAASLTEAFTELGETFESRNPGLKVNTSFGASGTVTQQVIQGAPADVLVTADEENMRKATSAGAAVGPQPFVRNRLAIMVQAGNPKQITTLADLAKPGLTTILCAPQVPCGKFALESLNKASVTLQPKSLEENVKGVVTKVTTGEADAGIVYVSDIRAAGDKAQGVDIPDAHNVIATYPIATVKQSPNPEAARAWIDLVLSDEGRQALTKHGFIGL